jgi:hypothetical protein
MKREEVWVHTGRKTEVDVYGARLNWKLQPFTRVA